MNQPKKTASTDGFVLVPQAEQTPKQVYFDGVTGMAVGAAVCKLDFHQVLGVEDGTSRELRKIVLTAVLPTAVLVEFCQNTLQSLAANSEILRAALVEHERKIGSGLPSPAAASPATKSPA